jgi:hypothetical protein
VNWKTPSRNLIVAINRPNLIWTIRVEDSTFQPMFPPCQQTFHIDHFQSIPDSLSAHPKTAFLAQMIFHSTYTHQL